MSLERLIGAGGSRLVDGVDHVDLRRLLQAVLHRGLALRLIALGILAANDTGVALLDAEALQESIVAQLAYRNAGRQVQGCDLGGLAGHRRLGILADQDAGLEVVGREQRIGRALRLVRGVQRDHR